MRSKAVIAMAVAGAFGWSASAFAAGSSHEVDTPLSVNESEPWLALVPHSAFIGATGSEFGSSSTIVGSSSDFSASEYGTGSIADSAGATVGGSFSSESMTSDEVGLGTGDESASLDMDESLALADEGVYSDYDVVSWSPSGADHWEHYVISTGSMPDELAAADDGVVVLESYEVAVVPGDEFAFEGADITAEASADRVDEAVA